MIIKLIEFILHDYPKSTKRVIPIKDIVKAVRTAQRAYKVVKGEKSLREFAKEYVEDIFEDPLSKNQKILGDDLNISFIDSVFKDKLNLTLEVSSIVV